MKATILIASLVTFLFGYNLGYQQYQDEYKQVMSNGITFRWKVEGSSVKCKLLAPTPGWVAVGFKNAGGRVLSNQIMGAFRDGQAFCEDRYVVQLNQVSRVEDLGGTNAVEYFDVIESNGITEMEFSLPLNSIDGYHYTMTEGEPVFVTLSYSRYDDFEQRPMIQLESKIIL